MYPEIQGTFQIMLSHTSCRKSGFIAADKCQQAVSKRGWVQNRILPSRAALFTQTHYFSERCKCCIFAALWMWLCEVSSHGVPWKSVLEPAISFTTLEWWNSSCDFSYCFTQAHHQRVMCPIYEYTHSHKPLAVEKKWLESECSPIRSLHGFLGPCKHQNVFLIKICNLIFTILFLKYLHLYPSPEPDTLSR